MKNSTLERNSRIYLFLSLCLLLVIPFLHQCVRTSLISDIPDTDGLGIAGHIEWFDLINETIQAFLIVPLYHLLNEVKGEPGVLKQRIRGSFVVSTVLYTIFSIVCFALCSNITQFMTGNSRAELISYLRLETVAFIAGHISGFAVVVFVVAGKPSYIVALTVGRTILTILTDSFFIPAFGVNGVACSNSVINLFAGAICFALVEHSEFQQVPVQPSANGYGWLWQWVKIGVFSGAQILLDNLIYALIVCKMVNDVAEQGNRARLGELLGGKQFYLGVLARSHFGSCGDHKTRKCARSGQEIFQSYRRHCSSVGCIQTRMAAILPVHDGD